MCRVPFQFSKGNICIQPGNDCSTNRGGGGGRGIPPNPTFGNQVLKRLLWKLAFCDVTKGAFTGPMSVKHPQLNVCCLMTNLVLSLSSVRKIQSHIGFSRKLAFFAKSCKLSFKGDRVVILDNWSSKASLREMRMELKLWGEGMKGPLTIWVIASCQRTNQIPQ